MTPVREAHLASRPAPSLYFINAPVDSLFIGAGSLIAYGMVWVFRDLLTSAAIQKALVYVLIYLGNAPHFSATHYRLYHSWGQVRRYPMTAFAVPLLILGGIVASLTWPAWVAPGFIKLYLLWSPFHYSGQSRGITLLYGRRGGFQFGKWERLSLSGFLYGSFLAAVARLETGLTRLDYFGIAYHPLGVPAWLATVLETGMWICGVAFLLLATRQSFSRRKLFPPILLLPAITQYTWFIAGPKLPAFFQLVPFFHGVQYLLIAWFMQVQARAQMKKSQGGRFSLPLETSFWTIANILGGIFLFWGFPQLLAWLLGLNPLFVLPLALAGVQIHHFFVDGVVWKLRHPHVGSPLMRSLSDLLTPVSSEGSLAA